MRGFDERSPGSSSGEAKKEGMPYYIGAFLAIALDWCAQAKTKAIEMQTLQALKREVATLKEEKLKLEDVYCTALVVGSNDVASSYYIGVLDGTPG